MVVVNVLVEIKGTSPLLQHAFSVDAMNDIGKRTRAASVKQILPRVEAERVCQRDEKGFYMSTACIARMLADVGSNHKQRGNRKSLRHLVPAAVFVIGNDADKIYLLDPVKDMSLVDDFEVDSRGVVIRATQGRIVRHRPRFDAWAMRFHLEIDDDLIDHTTVNELMTEGGRKNGIGDFRPQKGGSFGRFVVTAFQEGSPDDQEIPSATSTARKGKRK
jgi:hypothetical protein